MQTYLEHFAVTGEPFFVACFFTIASCIVLALVIRVADRFQAMRLRPKSLETERLTREIELLRLRGADKADAANDTLLDQQA